VKILAIRFARLGDVLLLLPALSALKSTFPDARLTFLTGHHCAPVGAMCPFLDEVMAVNRVAMRDGSVIHALLDMKKLVREVRSRRFDLAIDFHSFRETNLLTWLSAANRRLGLRRYNAGYLPFCFNMPGVPEDKGIHVRDMFLRVVQGLGSGVPAESILAVPADARQWAAEAIKTRPHVCFFVDSSGAGRPSGLPELPITW
jgi:ADP-heptose:LPS heptosyltransferase